MASRGGAISACAIEFCAPITLAWLDAAEPSPNFEIAAATNPIAGLDVAVKAAVDGFGLVSVTGAATPFGATGQSTGMLGIARLIAPSKLKIGIVLLLALSGFCSCGPEFASRPSAGKELAALAVGADAVAGASGLFNPFCASTLSNACRPELVPPSAAAGIAAPGVAIAAPAVAFEIGAIVGIGSPAPIAYMARASPNQFHLAMIRARMELLENQSFA